MINRKKYFRSAYRDISDLTIAFARAYDEAIILYPNVIRNKDARITIFAKCLNVSLNAEIGLKLFVSQVLHGEHFASIIKPTLSRKDRTQIQDDFQQFLKMGMVNAFYASLDSSFRTFVKVADPEFTTSRDGFNNHYAHTLKELGLSNYTPILDLFRLARNTLHTNGVHNAKTETIEYNGKNYKFTNGEMIDFLSWSFLAVLMYDVKEMLLALIKTKKFANADHIEDPFRPRERVDNLA